MKKNIGEFIPSYPEQYDKDFNAKLWAKQEFRELIPPVFEEPPKRGEAYTHQKYGTRFFTEFDRNLRLDEPGTGKSCIVVHSAELFKYYYQNDFSPPGKKRVTIKKCIILVKNSTLESNIREQIVCRCTKGVYETPKILQKMREGRGFEMASKKEVNKWYEIMTYGAFVKKVKGYDDPHLEEYMTDVAVYVDEAQYLVGSKGSDRKVQVDAEDDVDIGDPTEAYEFINKAFHFGKRNKIMLLTATPMINTAIQIVPLVNLLIPRSEALSMTMAELRDYTYEELLERLEKTFRGLVTYIRRPKTDVKEVYEGEKFPGINIPLQLVPLTQVQWDLYKQEDEKAFSRKKKSISNFVYPDGTFGGEGYKTYVEVSKISKQIVPKTQEFKKILQDPNGALGELSPKFVKILEICLKTYDLPKEKKIEKGVIFVYFPLFAKGSGAEILSLILEYNGYERYTAKKSVFDRSGDPKIQVGCGGSTEEVDRKIKLQPGRRFVLLTGTTEETITKSAMEVLHSNENRYGEYIQVVIGTQVLREGISIDNGCAVIFSSPPWNQTAFVQARDRIFRATSHTYKLQELRKEAIKEGKDPSEVVIPVKIYAMASIYQTDADIDQKDQFLKSYYTQDLKINLDEERFYEGTLNGKPVDIDILDPSQSYAPSDDYKVVQVLSVNDEPTLVILSKPRTRNNPEFTGDLLFCYNIKTKDLVENTILDTNDIRVYKLMQSKDEVIQKVFNVLRTVAVDCPNNYARNSRPETGEKDIKCWNIFDLPIDYSGKNLYYADDEINTVIKTLQKAFVRESYLSLSKILSLFPTIDPLMVSVALDKIIKDSVRYPVFDSYGRKQYIKKSDTGAYFITSDPFSFNKTSDVSYYSKVLIQENDPKTNLLRSYILNEERLTYEEIQEGLDLKTIEQKMEWFSSLDLYNKMRLYEEAKMRVIEDGKTSEFFDKIFEEFYNDSFELPEPIESLAQVSSVLLKEGYTQGKKASVTRTRTKRSAPLQRQLQTIEPRYVEGREIVYIHKIIPNEEEEITSYTKGKILGKNLRIYKPSEGTGFRAVNQFEADVYSTILTKEKVKKTEKYRKMYPIFGITHKDEFRIANQLKENITFKKGTTEIDKRKKSRGRVCTTLSVPTLNEVLAYFKIDTLFDRKLYDRDYKNMPVDEIRRNNGDIDFKGFDDESIRRFETWQNSELKIVKNGKSKKMTKADRCELVYNYLKENNMIFYESQIKDTAEGMVIEMGGEGGEGEGDQERAEGDQEGGGEE